MMLEEILKLTASLRIEELDRQIEELSKRIDLLRLLKQIAEIQEESQQVGNVSIPIPDEVLKKPGIVHLKTEQQAEVHSNGNLSVSTQPSNGILKRTISKSKKMPNPHSVAGRLLAVLIQYGGPMKRNALQEAAGVLSQKTTDAALKAWEGRTFEKVSFGVWKAKEGIMIEDVDQIPSVTLREQVKQKLSDLEAKEQKSSKSPYVPDILKTDRFPIPEPTEEQGQEEALNGNPFRVKAYLQRSQPAKPAIIAKDLNIPIGEVVMILQSHKCFTMNGNGWLLKKETKHATMS